MNHTEQENLSPAARHQRETLERLKTEKLKQAEQKPATLTIPPRDKNSRLTPAQWHKASVETLLAAQQNMQAGNIDDYGEIVGGAEEHLKSAFIEHQRNLKNIQSDELKAEYKAKYLPDFGPFISATLEADTGAQDDMFTMLMLWSVDAGLFASALLMAEYCFRHKLTMHRNVKRTIGTLLADEMAKAYEAGKMGANAAELLQQTIELTKEQDMPDPARGALHKLFAFELIDRVSSGKFDTENLTLETAKNALENLQRAAQLIPPNAGAKKEMEGLEKFITKAQLEAEKAADQTDETKDNTPPA